ncbi:glycosyltransferase family 9 protein [Magnetospira sp. QH-2]|uniref:glycosyltransferase family 9 protein n=1 Tax=Magnetospira sp. (strain QH-2) TaxID=1288970 RepID=UPI0003E80A71|nr:glycosyltransferase family 9 protein [Magnetospira sp. QH-2]CCQ73899.1 GT9 : distantly related to LPS heptosyl-2-transferase [Magnetospira sp. QH-2]
MKILFVTSTRVGDAILSTGLLDRLIRENPGARVTVACGPAAASLFEAVPGLERLIVLDKMAFSLHWLRLWGLTVGQFWNVLVDLRNAPLTYGLPTRKTFRIGRDKSDDHRLVQLARVMHLDRPEPPTCWLSRDHKTLAKSLIPSGTPVLALGPTANWIAKTWPPERFIELVERLTGESGLWPGARVALFGADHERVSVLHLIEAIPEDRRIDLIGRLDLLGVAACMTRCTFYVGNDSGLMHLASAAKIPTLGLFGPTPEYHYFPWGDHCAYVRPPMAWDAMFPENFDHRNTGSLMGPLSVDLVEEAAKKLWEKVCHDG